MQRTACVECNRLEPMRDDLSIAMHRERRSKTRTAIHRTQHANRAGVRLCKRLRIRDHRPTFRTETQLGTILAIGGDDIVSRRDYAWTHPTTPFVAAVL